MIESPTQSGSHHHVPEAPDSRTVAAGFAALAHPARIEIIKRLSASNSCCCRDVVDHLDLAQSTVSQHLKILVDAGLVRFAPDRQRSRYEVDRSALAKVSASLAAIVDFAAPAAER